MNRQQFDILPSNGKYVCPDCGSKSTHPALESEGCKCPQPDLSYEDMARFAQKTGGHRIHINKHHHTCGLGDKWKEKFHYEVQCPSKFQILRFRIWRWFRRTQELFFAKILRLSDDDLLRRAIKKAHKLYPDEEKK